MDIAIKIVAYKQYLIDYITLPRFKLPCFKNVAIRMSMCGCTLGKTTLHSVGLEMYQLPQSQNFGISEN